MNFLKRQLLKLFYSTSSLKHITPPMWLVLVVFMMNNKIYILAATHLYKNICTAQIPSLDLYNDSQLEK